MQTPEPHPRLGPDAAVGFCGLGFGSKALNPPEPVQGSGVRNPKPSTLY